MPLKRRFLSQKGRWIVSVWNKGKRDDRGRTIDGGGAAWQISRNGQDNIILALDNSLGVEIAVLDLSKM